MILHTVMPLEEVMKQDEKRQILEMRVKGRIIQVEPVSPTEGRVVRVISTNPQDFLDPATQPGSLVSLWGAGL